MGGLHLPLGEQTRLVEAGLAHLALRLAAEQQRRGSMLSGLTARLASLEARLRCTGSHACGAHAPAWTTHGRSLGAQGHRLSALPRPEAHL